MQMHTEQTDRKQTVNKEASSRNLELKVSNISCFDSWFVIKNCIVDVLLPNRLMKPPDCSAIF